MTKFKQSITKILLPLCLGNSVALMPTVSTQAQSILVMNEKKFVIPDLTKQQQRDVQTSIFRFNQALFHHQSQITLPFTGIQNLVSQGYGEGLMLWLYSQAVQQNRDVFQNGMYMAANVGVFSTVQSANSWTWKIHYFNTAEQDQQAWRKAQSLVKELNISSDQMTGMRQIYDYIRKTFAYDYGTSQQQDKRVETLLPRATAYGAWFVPDNGVYKTTCGGYAQMFYLMCRAMGWKNVYVATSWSGGHAYDAVVDSQGIHFIDPCLGRTYANRYFYQTQAEMDSYGDAHQNSIW